MITPRNGSLRRRRTLAPLVALTALAAFVALPGSASAATVECAAELKPSADAPNSKTAVEFDFLCSEEILAFTVTANRHLSFFDPEVLAFKPDGEASGEIAFCEGAVPGSGFGCNGKVGTGNEVRGAFEASKPICPTKRTPKGQLQAWVTVVTQQKTFSGSTFTTSSQPFHLDRIDCPKPEPKGSKSH